MLDTRGALNVHTSALLVGLSMKAARTMQLYARLCSDEVGWLGRVVRDTDGEADGYVVEEVYLVEQEVHGATTELSEAGMSKLYTELLAKPNGVDLANQIRFWGHSHVNMQCTPSGQDIKQLRQLASQNADGWYLACIINKRDEMNMMLALGGGSLVLQQLPVITLVNNDKRLEEEVKADLARLVKPLPPAQYRYHQNSEDSKPVIPFKESQELYKGEKIFWCNLCTEWHPKKTTCTEHIQLAAVAECLAADRLVGAHDQVDKGKKGRRIFSITRSKG